MMLETFELPLGGLTDVPTYATLHNRRLIVPNASGEYFFVERNLLNQLLMPSIARIQVDEAWYLNRYADVASIVKRKALSCGREHFIKFGYFEHRLPYEIKVRERWYLEAYPDVEAAVQREDFDSAQEHFDTMGYKEGRLPYAGFELKKI